MVGFASGDIPKVRARGDGVILALKIIPQAMLTLSIIFNDVTPIFVFVPKIAANLLLVKNCSAGINEKLLDVCVL